MLIEGAALISFGTWLSTKISDKGFDTIYGKLLKPEEINERFYNAVTESSKVLQNSYPDVLGGSINYFFKNNAVFDELIKLLFIDSKIDESKISTYFDIETLPENFIYDFIIVLKDQIRKDELLNGILSNKEIFILIQGISEKTSLISLNSTLELSEIVQIKKLLQDRLGSIFSYTDFIDLYYKNALDNLSQVNFIGLGVDIAIKRKRKNLQDVFIKPFFEFVNKEYLKKNLIDKSENIVSADDNLISYEELFIHSDRYVVLGNPGSGKSVLVKSLICDIIETDEIYEKVFPLRIELRKYLAYKKSNYGTLLKYIVYLLESEYNIYNLTESIIGNILKGNKSYLFFDGLDEIFKIEDKISIKNDIENFHNVFPEIFSLTTSRIIGYEDAKLNESKFCELNILSFNDDQITEYINRWYDKEEDNIEIRQKEVSGFLSKMHEIDRELVSNPLLLSLIVILYRNILKLPESKLEIYQSCTKTLVDKWDASKDLDIDIELDVYKNKEKFFADLAYWQYEQLSSENANIVYDMAKKTVATSIHEKLNKSDDLDCDALAESFMDYAQKRSIYFDNNFTHKTFLEYYAAYWLYSNIEKKHKIDQRNAIISKYINNPFWHIVLELLLNMIDKDQADSEIMDGLINTQLEIPNNSLPFLLSTLTSFKNISVNTIFHTIELGLLKIINIAEGKKLAHDFKERTRSRDTNHEFQIYDSFKYMFMNDNLGYKFIIDVFKSDKFMLTDLREIVFTLYLELELFFKIHDERLNVKLFSPEITDDIVNHNPYLFTLYYSYFSEPKNYFDQLVKFIENFGSNELFVSYYAIFESFGLGTYFDTYLNTQISDGNINHISENFSRLEDFGISKDRIVEYVNVHYSDYYFYTKENVSTIVNYINISSEDYIKRILLLFLIPTLKTRNGLDQKILDKITDKVILSDVLSFVQSK